MRDPDLVHRAERAASALERAWDRWRTMHGLDSEPLPPVSSYVGYSMEEPWGQPRVVFGVAAEEAERLAELLDQHDCFGPVHAEVTGTQDWRHLPYSDIGGSAYLDDNVSIPQQARPPALDMLPPVNTDYGVPRQERNVIGPFEPEVSRPYQADRPSTYATSGEAPLIDVGRTDAASIPEWAEPAESASTAATEAGGVVSVPEVAEQELAPLPPMPDPSPAGPMGSAALAPAKARNGNGKATGGPGYRGPRYQGSPPRYKTSQNVAKPTPMDTAGAAADAAVVPEAAAVREFEVVTEAAVVPDAATVPESAVAREAAVVPVAPAIQEAGVVPEAATVDKAGTARDPVAIDEPAATSEAAAVGSNPNVDTAGSPNDAASPHSASAAEAKTGKAASAAAKPARAKPRQAPKTSQAMRVGQAPKTSQAVGQAPKTSSTSRGVQEPKTSSASRVAQAQKTSPESRVGQASKASRTRQPGPGAHQPRESEGERAATDHGS